MATLEELKQKEARIKAQIRAKKRSVAADERKAKNHAKMVLGGMVLSSTKLDWKDLNFEEAASYFRQYSEAITARCSCDHLELPDAKKRLRNWEAGHNAWDSWRGEGEKEKNVGLSPEDPYERETGYGTASGIGDEYRHMDWSVDEETGPEYEF